MTYNEIEFKLELNLISLSHSSCPRDITACHCCQRAAQHGFKDRPGSVLMVVTWLLMYSASFILPLYQFSSWSIPDVSLTWMLWPVFHTCAAMAFLGLAFVTAFLCSVMCVFTCFHISRCILSHIHIACSRPCASVPQEVLDF